MAKKLQFFNVCQSFKGFRCPDFMSDPDFSSAEFDSDSDFRVFPNFMIPFLIPILMACDSDFDSSVVQI